MCGRFARTTPPAEIAAHFGVTEVLEGLDDRPDWNVTPRREVPVVREPEPHRRVLEPMRWGLVPRWAKDPSIGDRMINARAETLAAKPAFRRALARRRCVIPADGFYEWQPVPGRRRKQPWYFRARDGRPLAFAGLWEAWRPDDGAPWLVTCVIVTTDANRLMAPVHDRMPAILTPERLGTWLDPGLDDPAVAGALLEPAPEGLLECWPVSTEVNNPAHNGPELVRPLE
jgi:putative SOS response-associated peptidase YedK